MQTSAPISSSGATGMSTLPGMSKIQHSADEVRAECVVCGSHAFLLPGKPGSGKCGNCGSLELRELPRPAA